MSALCVAALSAVTFASEALVNQDGYNPYNPDKHLQMYHPPSAQDSRGPCPMLNTLANHGYINHSGRDIVIDDLLEALHDHAGIHRSAVHVAMMNALTLCNFVTGEDCGHTLKNLTILGLPHAFEHDHSFSRQDYKMNYLGNADEHTDNLNFNATIFKQSVDVMAGSSHMNMSDMNQVRLQRESNSMQEAFKGWFTEEVPIQEFEAAFIFGVMGDFTLPKYFDNPQVRMDWW